jgi:guanylate kinase
MRDMMFITEIEVIQMDNPLFLFVGQSASGKTTVANMLSKKYGLKQVESYTTRKPRFDGETGHIFISEDEFNNLGELAAYTYYNNNHYGTTLEQLNECDIYVVDVPGVETLLKKLKNDDRQICIFYFDTSVYNRILRMLDRHDSDIMIISRLLEDEKFDWFKKLDELVWHYDHIVGKNIQLQCINANGSISCVENFVSRIMQRYYYVDRNLGD